MLCTTVTSAAVSQQQQLLIRFLLLPPRGEKCEGGAAVKSSVLVASVTSLRSVFIFSAVRITTSEPLPLLING